MTTNTWDQCRDAYSASETTWRKSVGEKLADWSAGCGWCGEDQGAHAVLAPVSTADAVLATPYPPVDPLVAGYLRGEAIRSQLSDKQWRTLTALVHLIPDDHTRADVLPDHVLTGGAL